MRSSEARRNTFFRSLIVHEVGRPGVIIQGTGKRMSQVEKAAWLPGVDVEFQGCALADSNYCNGLIAKTIEV